MAWITKPKKVHKYNGNKPSDKRKERQKIYQSKRWQQLRLYYLSEHPLCEICEEKGIYKDAIDVHHKVSFVGKGEDTLFYAYDYSNLQALCKECHQRAHNSNTIIPYDIEDW